MRARTRPEGDSERQMVVVELANSMARMGRA
jgi:hypothetical protein